MIQDNSQLYAALDLGSNSFHLLVARFENDKLVIVDRQKELVRLASGLKDNQKLSTAIIQRALESLGRLGERIRPINPKYVRVVGTNTLRVARNSDTFLTAAEAILGVPINIISGHEEARLIYLGVSQDFAPVDRRLVVDIGGGSTELVLGGDEPIALESLYMGCVSFTQRYFPDGEITRKRYRKALLAAQVEVQSAHQLVLMNRWSEAVGSSGTIRAIGAVCDSLGISHDHLITPDALDTLADKVCECKHVDELKLEGLDERRQEVLPGGLAILHGVFRELGIKAMHTSDFTIREGIIHDLAGRVSEHDQREATVRAFIQRYSIDTEHAQRVGATANLLLDQVKDSLATPHYLVRRVLRWAIALHEIGLSVAHNGYQKHSAYLLANSDMPGFSRQEQKMLSFLVLNHRRKLRPMETSYGFYEDWGLVLVFRLACIIHRKRSEIVLPAALELSYIKGKAAFSVSEDWLAEHPLILEDLNREIAYWARIEINLEIRELPAQTLH